MANLVSPSKLSVLAKRAIQIVESCGDWTKRNPVATVLLAVLSFVFIFLPNFTGNLWGMFSSEPLVPYLIKHMPSLPLLHFSPNWITAPIGFALLLTLILLVISTRRAMAKEAQTVRVRTGAVPVVHQRKSSRAVLLILVGLVLVAIIGLIVFRQRPQYFSARPDSSLMIFKFPGALMCMYNSGLGKTLAPVNLAIDVQVTNLKPSSVRIYSYKASALISYQTDGHVIKESYPLFSVPISECEVYLLANDFARAKKLDFSSNDFDLQARNTQLREGESVRGWMFFEIDPKVRALKYRVEELNLTVENTLGEKQTIPLLLWPDLSTGNSILSSGEWHVMAGDYDLTKEPYTLTPLIDLNATLERHKRHPELYPPSPAPP